MRRLNKRLRIAWQAITRSLQGVAAALIVALALAACSGDTNPVAPYAGERPLQFLTIAQSFRPQVQWVGGRVAAIGVNRDSTAALDSTLVWMMAADDNTIESFVTVGEGGDDGLVSEYGGVPSDSLDDGQTYTFWMAEREVLDAGLDPASFDGFNFVDTTLTLDLLLRGRSLGGADVEVVISREQTLEGTRYIMDWEPALPFRQIGINQGRVGAFTDLAWHVVLPDVVDDSIYPPVVIGEVPPEADEIVEWSGFEPAIYICWMTNSEWEGNFTLRADGYAFFQVFESNFEEDEDARAPAASSTADPALAP